MEGQEGLASPFQQKLGFTQMLRVFRVDTSNLINPFQFFCDKDPLPKYGHILSFYFLNYVTRELGSRSVHLKLLYNPGQFEAILESWSI